MTTFAMVLGVIPLITSTGAGAKARFSMGLVMATGMAIGTIFTLFVVPMFYTIVSTRTRSRLDDTEMAVGRLGAPYPVLTPAEHPRQVA
jgi:multidrug efflux pump